MAYSIDSRTIQPGDIFIPIKGENFDGHDFIEEALRRGAAQVLDVDLGQFAKEQRSKLQIPIIAVTGSSGKTTAKELLATVLGQRFKVLKSAKNFNNEIGVPLTLLQIEPEHELAIIELGMRGQGEIAYLADIVQPTHVLITNIGYSHIERLGSQQAIAEAKAEVISSGQRVFLNSADSYYQFS